MLLQQHLLRRNCKQIIFCVRNSTELKKYDLRTEQNTSFRFRVQSIYHIHMYK